MRTHTLVFTMLATLVAAGCHHSASPTPSEPAAGDEGPGAAEAVVPSPPPPVQVMAGPRTPIEGPAPTIRVTSPRANQLVRNGHVMLRAQVDHWPLAPEPGNHVHVIIDNEPYIAVRDLSKPIDLNALVEKALGHPLAEGTHVLRMFPSRSQHESVKEGEPFVVRVFSYKKRTPGFRFDPKAPLLTYSRPKGCYPSDSSVLLDFYVSGIPELSTDGNRVRYLIDDSVERVIATWSPHYINHLLDGQHTIELTLIGPDGEPVPGPFNHTKRVITLAEHCV